MSDTFVRATQIAFIDANVSDRDTLIDGINPDIQVVVLDPNTDGVEQITQALAGGKYSAVHIISHGSPGSLQLGTAQLNSHNLATSYSASVQKWRDSLTPDADILLYGCNVAEFTSNSLIQQLSQLTGAEIAASNDLTGNSALGGDWELEVNTGLIEAPLAFQLGVMEAYNAVLGTTINVTNVPELIQAINDANSEAGIYVGADTINLAADTYNLTSGPYNYNPNFNWGNSGLPVISSEIIINGNNATIQGNSSGLKDFRLFTIGGSSGKLTLNDLTLTGGNVTEASGASTVDAGGLLNVEGTVTINNSTLSNNAAQDDGGAILNYRGTMTIQNSTISNNTASGATDPNGGGIENDAQNAPGTTFLTLINSTVSDNTAGGNGGGIRNRNAANITILNSTIAFNKSSGTGGGIFNGANATVQNSIVIGNTASSNPDVSGTFTSNKANIIGNTTGSTSFGSDITGITATTVLETTLANNGGSTLTHALIAGSPAIDAGNNANIPAGVTTDQRGTSYTRIFGTKVDIGAFEYSLTTVSLTVTDADADESGNNTGTYRISRGTASTGDLIVNLDIDPSSTVISNTGGTFPVDYSFSVTNGGNISGTGTTRTLTIPNGQTFVDLILNPNDDNYAETAETLKLNLVAGSYQIDTTNNNGVVTIAANDTPTISIDSVTKNEGTGGTNNFTFTVSLSNPTEIGASAKYSTIDGTAIAGSDYTNTTGTVTFVAGGATTQTIDIPITTDNINEAVETFQVQLSNAVNATISPTAGTGKGTITNDDTPTVSITPVSVTEGTGIGTTTANFTVSLSNPTDIPVTVNYSTANGTANSATDYTATTGTLTFNNLSGTSQNIAVNITRDDIYEPDETFTVNLTNTGATNATASATGTITNDDSLPQISIGNVSITEGNSGTTKATFTVKLSNASSQETSVKYATSDGTATVADNDYQAIPFTTLTFAAGETEKTIDVTVNGDTKFETDETFNVNLSNATNATIAENKGMGTITNDDTQPTISIGDVTVTEGNSGTTKATFTVKLANASSEEITVKYVTSDGTATVADNDYQAIPLTTLTFAAGETEKTIDVLVNGDNKFETDETFNLNLTGATKATIADNQGVGTINNDDTKPTVSISPINITNPEGNSGTTAYAYNVTLSNASNQTVTVNYSTNDGTATVADNDYADNDGNLTFNPGDPLTKTITVNVNGDSKFESDENFTVKLNSTTNADLGATTEATGTITNDDTQPTISISPATITNNEGNSGTTAYTYTVSLSNSTNQPVTVNYSTNDGTASVSDNDYVDNDRTLTFNPGDPLTQTITVNVNGDSKFETDEDFTVRLNSASNAILNATNQATGTIKNDDSQPTISINDITRSEGKSGTVNFDFTVTLSNVSSLPVSVSYSTADGTATAGSDYNSISTTQLTFNPGETSKTISVTVNGDALTESDENFFINLSNPINATIGDNQGVGNITNDDNAPTLSNIDKSGNEDTNISFTAADFTNKFSDVDGDSLSKIKITSLPTNGTLNLSSSNVAVNQEIVAGDLGNLGFTPDANWNGSTSFAWNGFDGANYANTGATVNLIVNPVNDPPFVFNLITDQSTITNDLFNYSFPADTFKDIDVGDNLTYTASLINGVPLPNWLFFNSLTRNFVGQPSASDVGTFTLMVKATDNAGASVTNPFNLTVVNLDPDCFCDQIPPTSPDSLAGVSVDLNPTNNNLFGGDGNDSLIGIAVNDGIFANGGDDWLWGREGNDNLLGGEGNDSAFGSSERDWIATNAGNDILNGNASSDVLNGNEGNDTLYGGKDNDVVRGGKNDDRIWGDLGDDTLSGDKGNDTVFGGTDNISNNDLNGRDLLFGGDGDDFLNGNAGKDTLFGNLGNDTVRGGLDDDIACGDAGDDVLFGDRGNDSLCGEDGNDTLYGGNGSPTPVGANDEQDYLCGGIGSDWLFGNEGQDWLNGEEGNDTVFGDKGNDTAYGGADNDLMNGNQEDDILYSNQGNDTVYGGQGNDLVHGLQNDDLLFGDKGNDTVFGDNGNDTAYGGADNDLMNGNQGNDVLDGNEGNDTLYGGKENDTLIGSFGDDLISGDLGDDTLIGGEGADRFVLSVAQGSDLITDFTDGKDLLVLSRGLTFNQLTITAGTGSTLISLGNQLLATVNGVQPTVINTDDFISIF